MLHHGPIALFLHGFFDYAAAFACFMLPAMFDVGGTADRWAIIAGALLLANSLTLDGPRAITDRMPVVVHAAGDFVIAMALVASPFVLDIDGGPARFFVALGVLHALVTIGTRFAPPAHAHVGSLAASTSTDIAAGERTVVD